MKEIQAPSSSRSISQLMLTETGAYDSRIRRNVRKLRRRIATFRPKFTVRYVSGVYNFFIPSESELHSILASFVPKIDKNELGIEYAIYLKLGPADHPPTQKTEIYCFLIVLIHLIDKARYTEAMDCASIAIDLLKSRSGTITDILASRVYYFYSLAYELTGHLAEIRGELMLLHRSTILRRDAVGQDTLLNLILRNYLHYNLYDQAEKFISLAPGFVASLNHQFSKYLFYMGKIKTIKLEYIEAKESLMQAAWKAPSSALGFRVQCNKWAIIVRLLLGEIPERTVFMQKRMKKALGPYFDLTNAVRTGDLELFGAVAEKFSTTFSADRTGNLIARLRHNVIRIGLRNISTAYSRISLADVAKKLRLDSINAAADAECIVSKAIRDGVIDAKVDHANGWMVSRKTVDIYSTNEPQIAFHLRTVFCLDIHNKAVQAHFYPPYYYRDSVRWKGTRFSRRRRRY